MNSKLNIARWVFLALAAVTVVIAVLYYLVVGTIEPAYRAGEATPRADLFLNWGYILILLGIVCALISVIFTAIIKGVNVKTLVIAVVAAVVMLAVAYFISKNAFGVTYQTGELTYSGKTHGLVEMGLNFFYITLIVAVLSILFSVIYKAVKK